MSLNQYNTHVRCVARIFQFTQIGDLDGDDTSTAMESKEFIEDDAIVSCTIAREKASPSATFQLTLSPIKNYYNLIKPGSWIFIYLDDIEKIDLKNLKGLKLVGIVNRIATNKMVSNDGTIHTTYTINGSDFGKVFEVTEFYYNPYGDPKILSNAIVSQLKLKVQGSPTDFLNAYLDFFLGDTKKAGNVQVIFPMLIPPQVYTALKDGGGIPKPRVQADGEIGQKGGASAEESVIGSQSGTLAGQGQDANIIAPESSAPHDYSKKSFASFNDILTRDFNDNANEGYALFSDGTRFNQHNLWEILGQSANLIINELFTDLRDGKPTLIFRKQMLKKDEILKHAKHATEISEKFILNQNLGVGDHEVFNYLTIFPTDILHVDQTYLRKATPEIAKDSTKRFGFRLIERSTEFGFTKGAINFELIEKWEKELKEYWFHTYRYENGTIDIVGFNDFKIGSHIKIKEQDTIYMVESINWEWTFGTPIITSLTVTYGMKSDGTWIDKNTTELLSYGTSYVPRHLSARF